MNRVPVELCGQRHRLIPKLHNSSQASAKRNGPRVAIRGFPVRCQGWLPGDEPALLQVVIDEVLQ